MEEIDMSRPGYELFPEAQTAQPYNSYQDVNTDQFVGDPLNTGVTQAEVAAPVQMSDKEMNFRALREEASKLKEEREYWKGQAEAHSKYVQQPARAEPAQEIPTKNWDETDWSEGKNVRQAFETLQQENQRLRQEFSDQLAAVQTKSRHNDWDNMVQSHVPQLTSKNPIFAEMIRNTSNPYEAAYLLAELNARAAQPGVQQPPGVNPNAQRALANAQKPQTVASIGGHGTLSSADYYATMSDEDFMKIASRNLAGV